MITRILLITAVFCSITRRIHGDVTGNQFMVGGSPAAIVNFPSFVHISMPNNGQCGGFIINSNHVVTAASCVLDANRNLLAPADVFLRFGFTTVPDSTAFLTQRIYVHPLFNPWTFDNDIAVLRTVVNITIQDGLNPNVFHAQINDRIIQDEALCTLVGISSVAPLNLRYVTQSIVSRHLCNAPTNLTNTILPSQFCTSAHPASVGSPCLVNRGGPLFCNNGVSGILSNGFPCNTIPLTQSIYTQVRRYIPWIMQQFTRTDLTPGGPTPPPTFPLLGGQSTILGCVSLVALSIFGLLFAG